MSIQRVTGGRSSCSRHLTPQPLFYIIRSPVRGRPARQSRPFLRLRCAGVPPAVFCLLCLSVRGRLARCFICFVGWVEERNPTSSNLCGFQSQTYRPLLLYVAPPRLSSSPKIPASENWTRISRTTRKEPTELVCWVNERNPTPKHSLLRSLLPQQQSSCPSCKSMFVSLGSRRLG